jgi:hypothetical protein
MLSDLTPEITNHGHVDTGLAAHRFTGNLLRDGCQPPLPKTEIIIIHLLGLAPAGCLAAPDNGEERRYAGECSQTP